MNSAELPGEAPDVLVVGAGNAALCAAISAHESGARVLMLEAAPFEERGGNSHFTGGAFRFAFRGVDDLIAVLPSLAQENLDNVDFGTYTEEQFFDDLFALTAIPLRSRSRRNPGARQPRYREVGGAAGREAAAGPRDAKPTRSTANSSSGAGLRSTSGAAGRNCSRRSTPMWSGAASAFSTRRRPSASSARTGGWPA